VLGTAVAGSAEFLISMDKDLVDLQRCGTVEIIRPGEFWARVTR
jgi:predicted nucleic acid-binding protein